MSASTLKIPEECCKFGSVCRKRSKGRCTLLHPVSLSIYLSICLCMPIYTHIYLASFFLFLCWSFRVIAALSLQRKSSAKWAKGVRFIIRRNRGVVSTIMVIRSREEGLSVQQMTIDGRQEIQNSQIRLFLCKYGAGRSREVD